MAPAASVTRRSSRRGSPPRSWRRRARSRRRTRGRPWRHSGCTASRTNAWYLAHVHRHGRGGLALLAPQVAAPTVGGPAGAHPDLEVQLVAEAPGGVDDPVDVAPVTLPGSGLDLAPDQLVEGRPAGQALQERGEAVKSRPVPFGPDRDAWPATPGPCRAATAAPGWSRSAWPRERRCRRWWPGPARRRGPQDGRRSDGGAAARSLLAGLLGTASWYAGQVQLAYEPGSGAARAPATASSSRSSTASTCSSSGSRSAACVRTWWRIASRPVAVAMPYPLARKR